MENVPIIIKNHNERKNITLSFIKTLGMIGHL